MKKLILLLLAASTLTTTVFAQKRSRSPLRFGIKAGGNLSHLSTSNDPFLGEVKNSFGFGAYGGGFLEVSGPAGSKLKGQVEALYSFHNFKNTYTLSKISSEWKTNLSQISIPVILKYFPIPSLSLNVGPSVNFNLASKTKIGSTTIDNKDPDNLQAIQIGALAGATYYIYKSFFVDARYNYYFGSMFKKENNDPSYRVSAIQLGVGYKF